MKIRSHLIAALAAVVIAPVPLTAQDGKAKGTPPFREADKDSDGKLTPEEFVAWAIADGRWKQDEARKKFSDFDTDKDGSLSRTEFRTGRLASSAGNEGKKEPAPEEKKK
jgi:hypothetical protein